MAVPWIKIETTLLHKPEVMRLAALLDCDEYKVTGHLVAFWSWVDANLSRTCPEFQGTKSGLDRVAGCPGFVDAMLQVGWLSLTDTVFTIPHFEYHLSQSAKTRGEDARKKAKSRLSKDKPGTNVPKKGGQTTDKTGTDSGPEERREEERDLEQQPGQPLRLRVQNANLRIPAPVDIPSIWEAITLWANHLDQMTAPHTLWQENSPQLAALFHQANEWGEKRFLAAMQWSMANGRYILSEAFEAKPSGKPTRARKADPGADEVWLHVCEVLSSTGDGPEGNTLRDRLLTPEQREAAKRARTRSRLEGCKCEKDRNDIAASFLETLKIVTFERQSSSAEIEAMGVF